jgi:hypothetical protein
VAVAFGDLGAADLAVPGDDLPQSADLQGAPDLSGPQQPDLKSSDLGTVAAILTVTRAAAPNNLNVTTEGVTDWEHYGYMGAANVNRKAGVTPSISHSTLGGLMGYGFFPTPMSWSDGTPTATANNISDGVYITGTDNGFTWVVLADTTQRTLRLYVGEFRGTGTLVAHLSDGSIADVVASDKNNGGLNMSRFEIIFRATTTATLTVSWRLSTDNGGGATDFQAATYFQ